MSLKYDTKAADTFEAGCREPIAIYPNGFAQDHPNYDPEFTHIIPWRDDDLNLWCYIAFYPANGDWDRIAKEDVESDWDNKLDPLFRADI